jgi:hypothetical protein
MIRSTSPLVILAKAGIHFDFSPSVDVIENRKGQVDSRLRGNEGLALGGLGHRATHRFFPPLTVVTPKQVKRWETY